MLGCILALNSCIADGAYAGTNSVVTSEPIMQSGAPIAHKKVKYKFKGIPLAPDETCRSRAVKRAFDVEFNHGRSIPNHKVDHICSLWCGGKDELINMQLQTNEESDKKDLVENTPAGCATYCTPLNSTPTRKVFNCK